MTGDLTLLSTMQASVRQWLLGYHRFEVPGSEEMSEDPEVGESDAYAAEIECEGNWDLLNLTVGLDWRSRPSIRVDYLISFERCAKLLAALFPSLLFI